MKTAMKLAIPAMIAGSVLAIPHGSPANAVQSNTTKADAPPCTNKAIKKALTQHRGWKHPVIQTKICKEDYAGVVFTTSEYGKMGWILAVGEDQKWYRIGPDDRPSMCTSKKSPVPAEVRRVACFSFRR